MWIKKHEWEDMKRDIKDLRNQVYCLRGIHVWGVGGRCGQEYIRCNHCYKSQKAETTQAGGE